MTLLDFIRSLFSDESLRVEFSQDPEGTLHEAGLDGVSPADVHDALVLAGDDQHGGSVHFASPPPPPAHDYTSPAQSHEAAVQYLNTYVTNTYETNNITNIDNSVHQDIDNRGGIFDQDIDNHSVTASGDGAVAAGGDINGTVTTGDGNQVGSGNVTGNGNVVGDGNQAVTGDGNTTSFGEGSATSTTVGGNVTIGDGGAFGAGDVTVDNSDNSIHHSGNVHADNTVQHPSHAEPDHGFDDAQSHHLVDDGISRSDIVDDSADHGGHDQHVPDHAIDHAAV